MKEYHAEGSRVDARNFEGQGPKPEPQRSTAFNDQGWVEGRRACSIAGGALACAPPPMGVKREFRETPAGGLPSPDPAPKIFGGIPFFRGTNSGNKFRGDNRKNCPCPRSNVCPWSYFSPIAKKDKKKRKRVASVIGLLAHI